MQIEEHVVMLSMTASALPVGLACVFYKMVNQVQTIQILI